jgi:Ca2+-binding EF-hand superfamily protein
MKIPLIGLGFANSIEEVKKMVIRVDVDNSGAIEFHEFLKIIKDASSHDPEGSAAQMTEFFKKLTSGQIGMKNLSFSTFANTMKREKLMDAITAK